MPPSSLNLDEILSNASSSTNNNFKVASKSSELDKILAPYATKTAEPEQEPVEQGNLATDVLKSVARGAAGIPEALAEPVQTVAGGAGKLIDIAAGETAEVGPAEAGVAEYGGLMRDATTRKLKKAAAEAIPYSTGTQASQEEFSKQLADIQANKEMGFPERVYESGKAAITHPSAAIPSIGESGTQFLAGGWASKALGLGASAFKQAVGINALLEGGGGSEGAREEIAKTPVEELRKAPRFQELEAQYGTDKALKIAQELAGSAAFTPAAIGGGAATAVTGGGAGGRLLESAFGTGARETIQPGLKGIARYAAKEVPKYMAKEIPEETIQGVTGQLGQNIAAQPYTGVPLTEGLVEQGVASGLQGAIGGGVYGGAGVGTDIARTTLERRRDATGAIDEGSVDTTGTGTALLGADGSVIPAGTTGTGTGGAGGGQAQGGVDSTGATQTGAGTTAAQVAATTPTRAQQVTIDLTNTLTAAIAANPTTGVTSKAALAGVNSGVAAPIIDAATQDTQEAQAALEAQQDQDAQDAQALSTQRDEDIPAEIFTGSTIDGKKPESVPFLDDKLNQYDFAISDLLDQKRQAVDSGTTPPVANLGRLRTIAKDLGAPYLKASEGDLIHNIKMRLEQLRNIQKETTENGLKETTTATTEAQPATPGAGTTEQAPPPMGEAEGETVTPPTGAATTTGLTFNDQGEDTTQIDKEGQEDQGQEEQEVAPVEQHLVNGVKINLDRLTPTQRTEWDAANENHNLEIEYANSIGDSQERGKRLNAAGQKLSAERRRITGLHTDKEHIKNAAFANKIREGASLQTKDGEQVTAVSAPTYGRVRVRSASGVESWIATSDIKVIPVQLPRAETITLPDGTLEFVGYKTEEKVSEEAKAPVSAAADQQQAPSKEAIEEGNYPLTGADFQGIHIAIENPAGSVRSGTDANGNKWEIQLQDNYGSMPNVKGADKDHLDVFTPVGLTKEQEAKTKYAYVVDQYVIDDNGKQTNKFDEHKVMLGYPSLAAAKDAYLRNYNLGWSGLGAITAIHMADLQNKINTVWDKPLAPKKVRKAKTDFYAPPSGLEELQGAIKKLGGIRDANGPKSAFSDYKGRRYQAIFNNGTNALTMDDMATSLNQYGYDIDGENGLSELLYDSLRGNEYYSPAGHENLMAIQEKENFNDEQARLTQQLEDDLNEGNIDIQDIDDGIEYLEDDFNYGDMVTGEDLNDFWGFNDEYDEGTDVGGFEGGEEAAGEEAEVTPYTPGEPLLKTYTQEEILDQQNEAKRLAAEKAAAEKAAAEKAQADKEVDTFQDWMLGLGGTTTTGLFDEEGIKDLGRAEPIQKTETVFLRDPTKEEATELKRKFNAAIQEAYGDLALEPVPFQIAMDMLRLNDFDSIRKILNELSPKYLEGQGLAQSTGETVNLESKDAASSTSTRLEQTTPASSASRLETTSGLVPTREAGTGREGLPNDADLYRTGELGEGDGRASRGINEPLATPEQIEAEAAAREGISKEEATELKRKFNVAIQEAYGDLALEPVPFQIAMDMLRLNDFDSIRKILNELSPKYLEGQGLAQSTGETVNLESKVKMDRILNIVGINMYKGNLGEVSIKELVQNSFDAVKAEVFKNNKLKNKGSINIVLDETNRLILIKDNGKGMDINTIQNAFLTLAGSDKEGMEIGSSSGGFGFAKAAFLYANEKIYLRTVRNGKVTTMVTSGEELNSEEKKATANIQDTTEPNGTIVIVKIPETIMVDGKEKDIWFPYSYNNIDFFKKPLLNPDIEVTFKNQDIDPDILMGTNKQSAKYRKDMGIDSNIIPIGKNADLSEYVKNTVARFEWGTADVYIGIARQADDWRAKHQILSAGIFQFDDNITEIGSRDKIPYHILIDVKPIVAADSSNYPFDTRREGWGQKIEKDIKALKLYIGKVSSGKTAEETVNVFKTIKTLPKVDLDTIESMSELELKSFYKSADKLEIDKSNVVEVPFTPPTVNIADGAVTGADKTGKKVTYVDVDAAEKAKKENEKKTESTFTSDTEAPKAADFLMDMGIDSNLPIYHNNTNFDYVAHDPNAALFFAELGNAMLQFKEKVKSLNKYGYERLSNVDADTFVGISIDKGYKGVNVPLPFYGLMLNPLGEREKALPAVIHSWYMTMVHEFTHIPQRNHIEVFVTSFHELDNKLAADGFNLIMETMLTRILRKHKGTYLNLRANYESSTTKNIAKSLSESKDAASSTSTRLEQTTPASSASRLETTSGLVPTRERETGREGLPNDVDLYRTGELGEGDGRASRGINEPKFSRQEQRILGASRKGLSNKEVLDRIPELAEHTKKMREADYITDEMRAEHQRLVDLYKTVEPYESVPEPVPEKQARFALANGRGQSEKKAAKYGLPAAFFKLGDWVQFRLDIPSYSQNNTWINSIHTPKSMTGTDASFKAGPVVGYESASAATNVKFGVDQNDSLDIATGKAKGTIATILGQWKPMSNEEMYARAQAIVNETAPDYAQWTQVGMDPERHSYFYDRVNQDVVESADEVIQIGPLVLAKNVVWGEKNLPNRYSRQEAKNVNTFANAQEAENELIDQFGPGIANLINTKVLNLTQGRDSWPEAARKAAEGFFTEAVYLNGKVYIDLLSTAKDRIKAVVLHELGEHFNLERMLGLKGYADLQNQIRNQSRVEGSETQRVWNQVKKLYPDIDEGSKEFISEVIAKLGENNPNLPWYRRLIAKIKAFLMERGLARGFITGTLTDADMHELLVSSLKSAIHGRTLNKAWVFGGTPAMASSQGVQVTKPAMGMFDPEVLDDNKTPAYKSREKMIEMPIDTFLKLAKATEEADYKKEGVEKALNAGEKLYSIPVLSIEAIDGNQTVTGHEGRHRAMALKRRGYTTMPVIIQSSTIRWSEQNDPEAKFDYVKEWPTTLIGENGDVVAFPISREEAPKAVSKQEKLLAPNGKPSNLNAVQHAQVRTPEFKKWFGNSKVLDSNGEPLVVYHGTDNEGIDIFNTPSFFTSEHEGAEWYRVNRGDSNGIIHELFLNIKKPFDARTKEGYLAFLKIAKDAGINVGPDEDGYFYAPDIKKYSSYEGTNPNDLIYIPSVRESLIKKGYDGLHINDQLSNSEIDTWVVFNPNQIKSATGNTGAFSGENDDILFSRPAPAAGTQGSTQYQQQYREWSAIISEGFDKLSSQVASIKLAFLSVQQLVENCKKYLPAAYNYEKYRRLRDGLQTHWVLAGDKVSALTHKVLTKMQHGELTGVVQDSTIINVDASKAWTGVKKMPATDIEGEHYRAFTQAKFNNTYTNQIIEFANQLNDQHEIKTIQPLTFFNGNAAFSTIEDAQTFENFLKAQEVGYDAFTEVRYKNPNTDRRAKHPSLVARYKAMPQASKDFYVQSNALLNKLADAKQDTLEDHVREAILDGNRRIEMNKLLRLHYEANRLSQYYSPLSRYGKFWFYGKFTDYTKTFRNFETEKARDKALEKFKNLNGEDSIIADGKSFSSALKIEGGSDSFILQINTLISGAGLDEDISEKLRDDIYQMYLSTLPEVSLRHSAQHRKGTKGYEEDAERNFANHMAHGASQFSNMKWGKKMEQSIKQLRDIITMATAPYRQQDGLRKIEAAKLLSGNWEELSEPGVLEAQIVAAESTPEVVLLREVRKIRNKYRSLDALNDAIESGRSLYDDVSDEAFQMLSDDWDNLITRGMVDPLEDKIKRAKLTDKAKLLTAAKDLRNSFGKMDVDDATEALDLVIEKTQDIYDGSKLLNTSEKRVKAVDIVDELEMTFNAMVNSATTAMDQAAGSIRQFGFLWNLGASLSSTIMNLFQTPGAAMPVALGKHEFNDVLKEFNHAYGEFIASVKNGKYDENGNASISAIMQERLNKMTLHSPEWMELKGEIDALNLFKQDGTVARTQTMDIMGIGKEGYQHGGKLGDFSKKMGWMFHHAERLNREVTLVAAYRLARAEALKKGIKMGINRNEDVGEWADAVEYARYVNDRSQLNYSPDNAARIFRGWPAAIALQFKKYQQGMLYLWGRTLADKLNGWKKMPNGTQEEKDAKAAAKLESQQAGRTFVALLTMQMSFAGALGLPLVGALTVVVNMIGDAISDADEPWDWRREVRVGLTDLTGEFFATAATKGLFNAFSTIGVPLGDIAGRMSLADTIFREPMQNMEGRDEVTQYLSSIAGPFGGLVGNIWEGGKLAGEGNYARGAETASPKVIKDILKSMRFMSEGASSIDGAQLKEMSFMEIFEQMAGFGSAELEQKYAERGYYKEAEKSILSKRQKILHAAAKARREGDTSQQEDVADWNKRHPLKPISNQNISASINATKQGEKKRGIRGYTTDPDLELNFDLQDYDEE